LDRDQVILPRELRFQRPATDFVRTGFSRSAYHQRDERTFTYEDVRHRYGLRIVFDPQNLITGVVLVPTREPMSMWREYLAIFGGGRISEGVLNRQLDEVRLLHVADEVGRPTSGWSCPSLLKAVHLMHHLDLVAGVKMQRCQAPGCREYFRVGPRSRKRLYCPPLPGKKQSNCASRASSALYRERKRERQRSDGA